MTKQKNRSIHIDKQINTIFSKDYQIILKEIEDSIDNILINKEGQEIILEKIVKRASSSKNNPQIIDGLIYQKIMETRNSYIKEQVIKKLPNGIINLKKFSYINYTELHNLLLNKNFKEADKLTQTYLCKLVELKTNSKKNWLYFTDIQFIPKQDLFTLDLLWKIYSKGKFGFSIQKKIWIKSNKKWDKLWEKICWLKKGVMKRYPQEFSWTLDAPEGHLPLFNQLRGTQTLSYLFDSIEW
uniref:GUN4-like domain-containing protein n=1 Tax=Dipterosiphonia australica TaxID=2007208 RepID=A0A1Z1MLD8_9FLOR|nr:hypothetical protein [Dipterosiphonia australica]ARW66746.1 hypothetical protein [Dipterosiphonia australica]